MLCHRHCIGVLVLCCICCRSIADTGAFDIDRWGAVLDDVRARAGAMEISSSVIDSVTKSPSFIPSVIKHDRHQAEFKMTLDGYLARTVSDKRIHRGRLMHKKYPTMLNNVEKKFGIQPHVILAFWGMESNYGEVKSKYKLTDSFLTLMYDGRREAFFRDQLLSLMKTADKNKLDVCSIYGSWAGAMGHFQFIPTTLAQYGVDGNYDGRIDVINSIGDAMFSAGNYLNKLGWNPHERIVRRVVLPVGFDMALLDGKTKKTLAEWAYMGVLNPDGTPIPDGDMLAGLVGDVNSFDKTSDDDINPDTDTQAQPVYVAYLTYPNFYRIKKWNNSNWYAIAIATLADELKK